MSINEKQKFKLGLLYGVNPRPHQDDIVEQSYVCPYLKDGTVSAKVAGVSYLIFPNGDTLAIEDVDHRNIPSRNYHEERERFI